MNHPRALLLTILGLCLGFAATGAAAESSVRAKVLLKLESLHRQGVERRAGAEYRSVAATLAQAEALEAGGETAVAQGYFRLALAKALALEEASVDAPTEALRQVAPVPVREPAPAPAAAGTPRRREERPAVAAPREEASPPQEQVEEEGRVATGSVVGSETRYTVVRGDTLRGVATHFGVSWRQLAQANGLDPDRPLRPGRRLRVTGRHIVPKALRDGLVINIPERTLYHFRNGVLARIAPVAVGRPRSATDSGWETPTGRFTIAAKVTDPAWRVPPSIRKEMEEKGEEVITEVPPGPANPLGRYALRTSIPRILIHGTNAPASIYGFTSHGCIRVLPAAMEEIFQQVRVSTPGEILYQPVKLALADDGRVYLEVHRDVYRRVSSPEQEVRRLLRTRQAEQLVDWGKVREVLRAKTGVAEDVSL